VMAFLTFMPVTILSQNSDDDDEDYYVSRRKGLEFGLNIGVYQANHKSANFYNGAGDYELGDNSATLYSIGERLGIDPIGFSNTYANVQDILNTGADFYIYDYSYTMRYDPGMMFGFKTVYFWNPESALIFNLDVVNLSVSGGYILELEGLPEQGQGNVNTRDYGVFGKERRMLSSLGYRSSMYIIDRAAWLFEFGATAIGVQVVENYINVENSTFDLISMPPIPGTPSNGATSNLTNVGFGLYGVIGLEALFEEGGNLEANFRISRDRIRLGSNEEQEINGQMYPLGYDNTLWNFSIYVTWMIPPHIGDFVRASF
jgi:hypothetical protein